MVGLAYDGSTYDGSGLQFDNSHTLNILGVSGQAELQGVSC